MLMKQPHISLMIGKEEFGYHRMENEDGVPFYVQDNEIIFEEGVNSDTVLFVPLTEKSFAKDRKSKFVMFRLRFDSSEHSTLMFGIDPNQLSWTDIELKASINRIIYHIDKEQKFVVDEVRDPMYPPSINHIRAPSQSIGGIVLELIEDEINRFGPWVLQHRI